MLVVMTRGEIRGHMLALMGLETGSLQAQAQPQLNAWIDQAYRATLAKMPWANTEKIARVTLGIDQIQLALPADVTPGGIISLAYWDADQKRHIPITHRQVGAEEDWEPLNAVGGAEDEAVRGPPRWWEEIANPAAPGGGSGVIRLGPPADIAYEIHIRCRVMKALASDSTVCPIDGEAVALRAMVPVMADEGDREAAANYLEQWRERIADLGRAQMPVMPISMGCVDHTDTMVDLAQLPNWDLA